MSVERIGENCEPALCTVLFMAGAGGSLRAGVTENPVRLTRSVRDSADQGHPGRRAGLCLAGRRHHLDGRRRADAGERLRLCADAGAGRADRVHPARATTMRRSAATPRAPSRSTTCCARHKVRARRGRDVSAVAARLPDGRAAPAARADRPDHRGVRRDATRSSAPIGQAVDRFGDILPTLVRELPTLRRPVGEAYPLLQGPVARRMAEAVWPHRAVFITPMAAVAGAVADEMLQAMVRRPHARQGLCQRRRRHRPPSRRRATSLRAGIFADGARRRGDASTHDRPVRGIATSGRGGRSFSLGIADCGDRAGRDRRRGRRGRDPDRQRRRTRPSRRSSAGRPASSIPTATFGDLPVTVAVGPLPQRRRSPKRSTAARPKPAGCGSAA